MDNPERQIIIPKEDWNQYPRIDKYLVIKDLGEGGTS